MSLLNGSSGSSGQGAIPFASATFALSRDQLLAGLFIVASANGMFARVLVNSNAYPNFFSALSDTFGVSAIVWGGWLCACYLILRNNRGEPASAIDLSFAGIILLLVALPGPHLSWLIVFGLAVYAIFTNPPAATQHKAAMIFLALTVPTFWGPLAFNIVATQLLQVDAFLVGKLIGTEQTGNMVRFVGSDRSFQIWPACSSFHNISQAAVAWMTLSQMLGRRWSFYDLRWCVLAGLSAMAVNLGRLTLIGMYREHFDQLHGSPGYEIAGLLALVAILLVCIVGLRRELFYKA